MKRGGGRCYYRPDDIDLLRGIRHLLYGEGYTIRGVQRILREQGTKFVQTVWEEGAPQPPHGVVESEEQDAEENETVETVLEEESGLRGRLSSLIGRDLGDRQDDVAARTDPPMTSAPMPRVDPADRALHAGSAIDQSVQQLQDAVPAVSRQPSPAVTAGVGGEEVHKLRTVLHDLVECRKLIDAVVTRPH